MLKRSATKLVKDLVLVWRSCCAYLLVSATGVFRNAARKKKQECALHQMEGCVLIREVHHIQSGGLSPLFVTST
jgi:hypothetical protein